MNPEIVWEGPEALRPYLVEIRQLQPHPGNPRRGKIALIAESLKRFGQVRAVLVDGARIIAGHQTTLAATELGWTHVAAIPNEFPDEAEANAYLLADNRLPELGSYDRELLIAHLADVEASGQWEGTGYQPDDLEDLRALQGQIAETDRAEFTGGYAADPEELARRAAALAGGNSYQELVLTLDPAENGQFETHMKILRHEYGDGSVAEIIVRALTEQATRAAA